MQNLDHPACVIIPLAKYVIVLYTVSANPNPIHAIDADGAWKYAKSTAPRRKPPSLSLHPPPENLYLIPGALPSVRRNLLGSRLQARPGSQHDLLLKGWTMLCFSRAKQQTSRFRRSIKRHISHYALCSHSDHIWFQTS